MGTASASAAAAAAAAAAVAAAAAASASTTSAAVAAASAGATTTTTLIPLLLQSALHRHRMAPQISPTLLGLNSGAHHRVGGQSRKSIRRVEEEAKRGGA